MVQHRLLLLSCIALGALLLLAWVPSSLTGALWQEMGDSHPIPGQMPTPIPLPLITHGSRDVHEVALTFDACPGPGYGAAIVHVLTETGTPATFFLSGQWMQRHVAAVQALAAVPYFELGDHSWSHPHFSSISLAQMDSQITRTEQLLTQLTGRQGKLFRFPYGHYSPQAVQKVYRMGLTPIQWDVVSADPAPAMSAKRITARVLAQAQNGSIIIMHVNGRGWHTAEALPDIIAGLHAQGLRLVTVSQLLADSALSPPGRHRQD